MLIVWHWQKDRTQWWGLKWRCLMVILTWALQSRQILHTLSRWCRQKYLHPSLWRHRSALSHGCLEELILRLCFVQNIYTIISWNYTTVLQWYSVGCLGDAAVRCRTRDRKVTGSTPSWDAIKSTRSTQPSIPPGKVNRVPACMAGVRRGAFTCVGWQVTLCDPTWQVTFCSCEMECH